MRFREILLILFGIILLVYGDSYYSIGEHKICLTPLKSNNLQKKEKDSIKYYKKENGEIVGIENQLFIKLKSKNNLSLLKENNLKIIKSYNQNLYLVESNTTDIFKLIHKLNDNNATFYVYPNLFKQVERR